MARLVVVGISLATGIGAAVLASGLKPPEILPVMVAKEPVGTIVVAAAHLEYGTTLTDAKLVWRRACESNGEIRTSRCIPRSDARRPHA